MKKTFSFFVFSCLLLIQAVYSQPTGLVHHLMPVPARMEKGNGRFTLTQEFTLAIKGKPHQRIYGGATRMLRRLDGRTGLFFSQAYITSNNTDASASLQITVDRPGKVILNEDESYTLTVTSEKIKLTATTDIGALRGLETILQLVGRDENGYYLPAVTIQDAPRFPWRGLLIDAARHFMPIEVIKRNLDGMAAVKLNVLHWHLTDDQGFRVETNSLPKLHELGSDGQYYTQEQIKEIIQYADSRGIRVVPEFDVPGHATSWFVGYPELASAPGPYTIERKFGIKNPTFDPTKEETYTFLDTFIKEMAALFPDEYLHIGGDENNGKQWKANTQIQAFMKANNLASNHDLQTHFIERALKIVTRYNKKMMGWDEIWQPGITKSIMIQSWRGKKSLFEAARKGYTAILSNGYYIDLAWSTSRHYLIDPVPADADLTDEQKKNILGGEAAMWSELATEETIDSRIWPRTAAIAERFWSPGSVKDVEDMYRRLDIISLQLEEVGLLHEKNYEMMLRRLAGCRDITSLKTLVDVLEPVEDYKRHGKGNILTSFGPYTLVPDAANPDAAVARKFRFLTDQYISSPNEAAAKELTYWLTLWKNNHAAFQQTLKQAPILKDVAPLSQTLSAMSEIGLQAMEHIRTGKTPSASWVETTKKQLEEAKKPQAKCELKVVEGIEKLVQKAAKATT
ncbi:family 20 glycosylhydrolase [Rhodocytophaga aerolata]|uniref:Family 20 glycosylhydrolase n=1 Tax=Rhodocytophaga aerolata TaxID=455078 RepID=A0ABT8R9D4_9BACT|nr:family 20 glycosylhydrolase [Rhodocytophaga aerolata]MDO1448711.1 family 20 glycosylhydrolase [Rhodocytophaga aerolata]